VYIDLVVLYRLSTQVNYNTPDLCTADESYSCTFLCFLGLFHDITGRTELARLENLGINYFIKKLNSVALVRKRTILKYVSLNIKV
jgi:hypothetical protein